MMSNSIRCAHLGLWKAVTLDEGEPPQSLSASAYTLSSSSASSGLRAGATSGGVAGAPPMVQLPGGCGEDPPGLPSLELPSLGCTPLAMGARCHGCSPAEARD